MNQQILFFVMSLTLSIFPLYFSLAKPQQSPQTEQEPARNTEAAGTRGCDQQQANQTKLILLPSGQQLHSTISPHPTFFWYLGNLNAATPPTLRFTLIEPGVVEPVYETAIIASQSGVWVLKLPPLTPKLTLDKQYRWTVTLICNELKPSSNKSDWAWIQRISVSATLEQKLATAVEQGQRSQILAQAGLWHDVYEVLMAPNTTQTFSVFALDRLPQAVQTLLFQRGIAKK